MQKVLNAVYLFSTFSILSVFFVEKRTAQRNKLFKIPPQLNISNNQLGPTINSAPLICRLNGQLPVVNKWRKI